MLARLFAFAAAAALFPAAVGAQSATRGHDGTGVSEEARFTGLPLACAVDARSARSARVRVTNRSGVTLRPGVVLIARGEQGVLFSAARLDGYMFPGETRSWRVARAPESCRAETAA